MVRGRAPAAPRYDSSRTSATLYSRWPYRSPGSASGDRERQWRLTPPRDARCRCRRRDHQREQEQADLLRHLALAERRDGRARPRSRRGGRHQHRDRQQVEHAEVHADQAESDQVVERARPVVPPPARSGSTTEVARRHGALKDFTTLRRHLTQVRFVDAEADRGRQRHPERSRRSARSRSDTPCRSPPRTWSSPAAPPEQPSAPRPCRPRA